MFYRYKFEAEMICLGERLKKGTYRPTLKTIPCSQIMGALEKEFGKRIPAAGYFTTTPVLEHITFSLHDHTLCTSKLPLTVEYLRNATGMVFIKKNADIDLTDKLSLKIGALKSKGFGNCLLNKEECITAPSIKEGRLKTRLYEELLPEFGIEKVFQPVYGYLFVPTGVETGHYTRSLLEGSMVEGYDFLLEVSKYNGAAETV